MNFEKSLFGIEVLLGVIAKIGEITFDIQNKNLQ